VAYGKQGENTEAEFRKTLLCVALEIFTPKVKVFMRQVQLIYHYPSNPEDTTAPIKTTAETIPCVTSSVPAELQIKVLV